MNPSVVLDDLTIHPVNGAVIPRGRVVFHNGRITAVGPSGDVNIPRGARVHRHSGCHLTPGYIDAHMHAGLHQSGVSGPEAEHYNEATNPLTPELRAEDGINPRDEGFSDALRAGVTTVCVLPGSANVVGGLAVTLRTWGGRISNMMLPERPGMKIAFGENPCRIYRDQKKSPSTRMAVAALLRDVLERARAYMHEDRDKDEPRHLGLDALGAVLRREIPVRIHAHRAHDMETALRIVDEFKLRAVLDHCTEGFLICDEIARRGIPAIIGPDLSSKSKLETGSKRPDTAAVLVRAGVTVALMSDHPVTSSQHFQMVPVVAHKHGLGEEEALMAVTLAPARILGVDGRLGSVTEGKQADLVVWSGPPLNPQSQPLSVWGDGVLVHGEEGRTS